MQYLAGGKLARAAAARQRAVPGLRIGAVRDALARISSTALLRATAAVLGVAIFATGVVAVFGTENGTGAAALLAIGAAFVVFGALGERIERVELGGVTLSIKDLARQTFSLARELERGGDDQAADHLRSAGSALEELADEYRRLRGSMRAGGERTSQMEHVVLEAKRLPDADALDPEDVSEWFHRGKPEARVIALGLMEGNARLRDFDVALEAIERSRSAFEQYHGLKLAEAMIPKLSPGKRAQLKRAVEHALGSRRVREDEDRYTVATRIKDNLKSYSDGS